jgi:NAD-dependent DNA ligase
MQIPTASTSTSSALFRAKISTLTHQDKKVCFTGRFEYGKREMCQAIAKGKGATSACGDFNVSRVTMNSQTSMRAGSPIHSA